MMCHSDSIRGSFSIGSERLAFLRPGFHSGPVACQVRLLPRFKYVSNHQNYYMRHARSILHSRQQTQPPCPTFYGAYAYQHASRILGLDCAVFALQVPSPPAPNAPLLLSECHVLAEIPEGSPPRQRCKSSAGSISASISSVHGHVWGPWQSFEQRRRIFVLLETSVLLTRLVLVQIPCRNNQCGKSDNGMRAVHVQPSSGNCESSEG
jgi:hypothetical protein